MRRVLFLIAVSAALAPAQPSLVLHNGRIWTGSPQNPWAEAVAIDGNLISAVGSNADVLKRAASSTRRIDLHGKLATPGINDAHIHFLGGSRGLGEIDLNGICTLETIQAAIAKWAAAHPAAPWVRGSGWEYACFGGSRLPTRADLDAVVPDRPAFIVAYDGHTAWANSKALAIAGIQRGTKYEGFGSIRTDASGEPTGALLEGAQALVRNHIPPRTRAEDLDALRAGMKMAAALGVTSIQNANGNAAELSLYEELLQRGELTLRVALSMSMPPPRADFERYAAAKARWTGPLLRVQGLKFMLDGVIESHTAAMLDNYSDGAGTRGDPAWTPEQFSESVIRADKAGWQIMTHAIGDRAVRIALDSYEAARNANHRPDSRFRIEHIETIQPSDIPRFVQLGVMPSMQPIHADPGTVEVWSRAVGAARLPRSFAWQSFLQAGAPLVFASDWPACLNVDPMRGLHNAVNRRTITGLPPGGWLPEQRVNVDAALTAYTRTGAYASFEESIKGTLEPGKLADIAVWSQNVFTIDPMRIHQTRADLTVFDGRVIYQRPAR